MLDDAIRRIDALNAQDPRLETDETGAEVPKELLYSRRMTEWLMRLRPDASEALQIAVRAQHLCRWRVPRDEYPMDRAGYKAWRRGLLTLHADLAAEVAAEVGYDETTVERVRFIIKKRKLKSDPETQALEDCACLVFLQYVFAEFGREHSDEKLVDILRKTWSKMSARGHELAAGIALGEREQRIVAAALAG